MQTIRVRPADMGATSLVPPGAPLAMPEQSLAAWGRARSGRLSCWRVLLARFFVFSVALLLAGYGAWQMYEVVGQRSATSLQILLVVLFAVTFSWIALAAATALLGFFAMIAGGTKVRREASKGLSARTAILMPIYNEDADTVFQALARMARDVEASGHGRFFDIFVLSDSTDVKTLQRERAAANRLRSMLDDGVKVYYRRRLGNEAKKAGNVADFVRRWGGAYDFMVVLDADSYMTAGALVALVQAMEADPKAGLIQTVPQLADGKTLFARLQQFAAATYGPLLAGGLALWHGRDGNYWGHNAIIRVRAFAEACGLPQLRGGPPLGGHILSHDFVEAALLRRAGYSVYMRPDIEGSFEGTPPTLGAHAARDRRWAQGNLQHGRIVPAAGLHWMSRFHLVNGIMSYLASPLWLMFLVTGIALSWVAETVPPNYFPSDFALYPTWPRFDARQAFSLLGVSILVLLAPKLLAWAAALVNSGRRQAGGGALALTGSVVLELLFSSLLAPVMMLMQSRFVLDVLLGRDAGWAAQQRREQDAPLSAIARQHFGHSIAGIALSYGTLTVSVQVWLWLLPVWLGLSLAIPLAWLTARSGAGDAARRAGLFLVAGESEMRESRPILDEEAVPG
jgi:membrane glycosyltransferase